jgi:hypothetical protein
MSERESSLPSRSAVLSVIGALEGRPASGFTSAPTPPTPQPPPVHSAPALPQAMPPVPASSSAPQPGHDQLLAALREMTVDRDAWRAEATSLRDSLTGHLAALRGELAQHLATGAELRAEVDKYRAELDASRAESQARDEQLGHLTTSMAALIKLAQSRFEAAATAPAQRQQPTSPAAVVAAAPVAPMAIPTVAPDRPEKNLPRLGVERTHLVVNKTAGEETG